MNRPLYRKAVYVTQLLRRARHILHQVIGVPPMTINWACTVAALINDINTYLGDTDADAPQEQSTENVAARPGGGVVQEQRESGSQPREDGQEVTQEKSKILTRDQILGQVREWRFSQRNRFFHMLDDAAHVVPDGLKQVMVKVHWPDALLVIELSRWNAIYNAIKDDRPEMVTLGE